VDKLGMDFRGDPSSALLEILDPAQNFSFRDHYLDLPFDLSKVFFIATANSLAPIPPALRDRMEIIQLSGYTEEEKLHIAKRYLVKRQISDSGLKEGQLQLPDETIQAVISRYTREAGVRQLERTIGKLARKVALKVARSQTPETEYREIKPEELEEYLGHERFFQETARDILPPGVATGLAVTEMGGEVLFIEATKLPGSKGLTLTGQLGAVMQESAKAAHSYLWSHSVDLGIDCLDFEKNGIHVHVPAGAIPKDGPSAGVAIVSAFASLCSGRAVRSDTAMTGEITLSGLVFPVGGIKGKVLAAKRAGIKRVVLPKRNEPDVKDIPEEALQGLEIVFVQTVDEALQQTLTPPPAAKEPADELGTPPPGKDAGLDGSEARA
jgi:ATP-dependent Lon protease